MGFWRGLGLLLCSLAMGGVGFAAGYVLMHM